MAPLRRPLCIHWYYVNYSQHVCWHWRVAILSAFAAQVPQLRPNLSIWNGRGEGTGGANSVRAPPPSSSILPYDGEKSTAIYLIQYYIYLFIYLEASCWQESRSWVDRQAQRKDKDCWVLTDTDTDTHTKLCKTPVWAGNSPARKWAGLPRLLSQPQTWIHEGKHGGWLDAEAFLAEATFKSPGCSLIMQTMVQSVTSSRTVCRIYVFCQLLYCRMHVWNINRALTFS